MILVWRITDDLPNSPNFSPAKLSRYTVYQKFLMNKHNHKDVYTYAKIPVQSLEINTCVQARFPFSQVKIKALLVCVASWQVEFFH